MPGAHYAFIATQRGSEDPVGWDPCEEIRYAVNPEGAPPGWEALIEDGIDEIWTPVTRLIENAAHSPHEPTPQRGNSLRR